MARQHEKKGPFNTISSILTLEKELRTRFKPLIPKKARKMFGESAKQQVFACIANSAKLAFGAYHSPSCDDEGFIEYNTKENIIRYLNWKIVDRIMEGCLKITLHSASDLIDIDFFHRGVSDPYVVFEVDDSFVKSTCILNDLNPVWGQGEVHYLFLRKYSMMELSSNSLKIDVFDKDTYGTGSPFDHLKGRDKLMGTTLVDLSEMKIPGKIHEFDAVLSKKGVPTKQKIKFSVEFVSVGDAERELEDLKDHSPKAEDANKPKSGWKWFEVSHNTHAGNIEADTVMFIDSTATGTQAWVHVNDSLKTVEVSFRGTEANKLEDILTDLWCVPGRLSTGMVSPKYKMKPAEPLLNKRVKLHSGFKNAYDSIREPVLQAVYELTKWSSVWSVHCSGHSLGGALATICAYEIANRTVEFEPEESDVDSTCSSDDETESEGVLESSDNLDEDMTFLESAHTAIGNFFKREFGQSNKLRDENHIGPYVAVITFGAPKVGTSTFSEYFDDTVTMGVRVVNPNDPVTMVPPFYSHTSGEVLVESHGGLRFDKKRFVKGHTNVIMNPGGVASFFRVWGIVNRAKHEAEEAEDLNTESSRLSVAAHLQPRYFDNIKKAVQQLYNENIQKKGHAFVTKHRNVRERDLSDSFLERNSSKVMS